MYGLSAFDSARAALEQSGYRLGLRDRETSIDVAAELVNYYQGNQRQYLELHLNEVFSDPKLRVLYKSLIFFSNVTALIVDRVTILGKRKAEVTFTTEAGEEHEADQALWNRISDVEIENGGFDAFLAALGTYKELFKTAVALPYWDPRAERLRMRFYTPNIIDVAWDQEEGDPLSPTAYRILLNDQENRYRVYDFSDPLKGLVYDVTGVADDVKKLTRRDKEGRALEDATIAAIDPKTGRVLDPFVPFRTAVPWLTYFVEDGQAQLLEGQRAINRLWTQLMGILHSGAFQVPILEGPAWGRQERGPIVLTMDPSQGIRVPSNPGDTQASTLRWGGPANEGYIGAHLEAIASVTETLVSTFHISPNEVVAKANPASGVSLFIGNSALKEKQERSSTLDRASLRSLVYKTAVVWNAYAPRERERFSLQSKIDVKIPTQPLALDPLDEVKYDALKVAEGFALREDIVKKYNPGITAEKLAQIAEQKAPPPAAPAAGGGLFRRPGAPAPPAEPPMPGPKMPGQKPPPARGGAPKPAGPPGRPNAGQ